MSTDIDWQHELDTSFGSGHDLPPAHYVAAGRTAVRRRRSTSLAIGAAVAVCVGAAWASGPGGAPRGAAPVATQPASPTADAEPSLSAREARRTRLERMREAARESAMRIGNPGALTWGGDLVLVPGAGPVLERVPNPMGYTDAQGRSVGIRVMMDGQEQYALLTTYPDGTSGTVVARTGDFQGWLAQAVRTQQALDVANGVTPSSGDPGDQPWLALDAGGTISAARPGIVVTEQRAGVDLGAGFASGATRTGVVRLVVDGRTEYAAYRVIGGTLDVVPGGGSFDSLPTFITWARAQYSSGAGMR